MIKLDHTMIRDVSLFSGGGGGPLFLRGGS